jgi:histidinol phosphatase-like enzyme (inositol monophosphatase family)
MTAQPPVFAQDIEIAKQLAEAGRVAALKHFRKDALQIDNKLAAQGAFDPVTNADREVETAIREILARERPEDGVLGEEHRDTVGTSGRTWVIDPIDGTRAFMCGLPTWGILIALNDGTRPVLGVMDQPFTGERYVGVVGEGSTCQHDGQMTMLYARRCPSLADAVMCSTDISAFANEADAARFFKLSSQVRLTRYGTDCYAYAMLARGQIDLVVESGLNPYDIQAMIPIVEAAGGIVTNWQGDNCQQGGQVIAAGDAAVHAAAMAVLASPL